MKEPESLQRIKEMFNSKLLTAFKWFLGVQLFLGFLFQTKALFTGAVNDQTVAASYFVCMLTALVMHIFKNKLFIWGKQDKPGAAGRFILIGSLGAVWVETVFWAMEKFTGASGVAANPNLIVDLLATMPWYVSMLAVLSYVQKRCGFHWITILFLGGIYEVGADGIVSQIIAGTPITTLHLMLLFVQYSTFVIVYSPIVLPAVWSVPYSNMPKTNAGLKKFLMALFPLLPLIPYSVIAVLLFRK